MTLAAWWCHLSRYPDFRRWPEADFKRLHARHAFHISLIVVPGMLLQGLGSVAFHLTNTNPSLMILNWILLAASIGPTFFVTAPIHGRLSKGKDMDLIDRLLSTNLPRTIAWTLHFVLAIGWLVMASPA